MGMAQTSSPENYSLGRGRLYFNRKLASGLYDGERDLGNAPDFSVNVQVDWLEHFSSRSGLKSKDKRIAQQITPEFSFMLDEIVAENLSMTFLAEIKDRVQAAVASQMVTVVAKKSRFVELGKRYVVPIGTVTTLVLSANTGNFTVGEIINNTDGVGSATVESWTSGTKTLTLTGVTGVFPLGDDILGATSAATGTSAGAPVVTPGTILVQKGAVTLVANTDYTIDSKTGRIYFVPTSVTVMDGDSITVTFGNQAKTETELNGFKEYQVEGVFRFVSDNPTGENMEIQMWNATLSPDGDTGFIGDKWTEVKFKGEMLKDEAGHPDSPYCSIIMG